MKGEKNNMRKVKETTAWCPDCGDALEIEQETLKPYENWHYYCFGCDKHFEIVELKE